MPMLTEEAVISVPAEKLILVPFPIPGSVSKKYSSRLIFAAVMLGGRLKLICPIARIEQATNTMQQKTILLYIQFFWVCLMHCCTAHCYIDGGSARGYR